MRSVAALCTLALIAFAPPTGAQPPAASADKEAVARDAAKAAEFAAAEAVRYDIRHADERKKALKLRPEPVLLWSNPTNTQVYGAAYVWTRDGCPEAAASFYQFFGPALKKVNAELVSLTDAPLTAERNGRVRWTAETGVKFEPLPNSPTPAATADQRQFQVRAQARRFTGSLAVRGDDSKFDELRLLAKPLYRYEATDGSGREGALFSLATANDPEILLLIESRKGPGGREWAWAAGRMNFRRAQLKLADKVVWDVPTLAPPWQNVRGPKGDYVILEWPTPEAAAKD